MFVKTSLKKTDFFNNSNKYVSNCVTGNIINNNNNKGKNSYIYVRKLATSAYCQFSNKQKIELLHKMSYFRVYSKQTKYSTFNPNKQKNAKKLINAHCINAKYKSKKTNKNKI